jgi:hypothetical protein
MKTLMICILLLAAISLAATHNVPDSLSTPNLSQAAIQTAGINLGVWSADRYIAKAEWAYISLKSVKHNLSSGFVFDDSQFLMNQFLHPYTATCTSMQPAVTASISGNQHPLLLVAA